MVWCMVYGISMVQLYGIWLLYGISYSVDIWWEIAYMVYLYGRCFFYGISYGIDTWWVDFIWYLCMVDACSMVYHMVNIYGKNVYGTFCMVDTYSTYGMIIDVDIWRVD